MVEKFELLVPAYTAYTQYNGYFGESMGAIKGDSKRAIFMPELIDVILPSLPSELLFTKEWMTPSIMVEGTTRGGAEVVVIAHTNNFFSNLDYMATVNDHILVNGGSYMPETEFYKLLDKAHVYVMDKDKLVDPKTGFERTGYMSVDEVLAHPLTIPFMGGEERAQNYLNAYSALVGNKISLNYEITNWDGARAHPLCIGINSGLDATRGINFHGRFLGK